MNKLKTFAQTFYRSLTSPKYYRDVLQADWLFSLKYFILLHLVVALGFASYFGWQIYQFNPQVVADQAVRLYPADLQLWFEDGELRINQDLPYSIEFPSTLVGKSEEELAKIPPTLVTFTTDDEFSGVPSFFDDYQSLAVVTETTVYFGDPETSEVRAFSFSDDATVQELEALGTIDRELIRHGVDQVLELPFIKHRLYVPIIVWFLWLVMFVAVAIGRMIILTIYAGLSWLMSRIFWRNLKLGFGQMYRLSLHAITLIMVLGWIDFALPQLYVPGVWRLVIFLGWMAVILSALDSGPAQKKSRRSKSK